MSVDFRGARLTLAVLIDEMQELSSILSQAEAKFKLIQHGFTSLQSTLPLSSEVLGELSAVHAEVNRSLEVHLQQYYGRK